MSFPEALPGRRERRMDSTRARLFQAALDEFRRVGFDHASVSRITRKAGVSRSSFYFHFPKKEHVLLELEWIEERRLLERIESAESLREALGALAEGVIDLHERLDDPDLIRDMYSVYARRPAELHIDEQPYPIGRTLTRLFRAAAERRELREGLEPDASVRLFMAGLMGLQVGPQTTVEQLRADIHRLGALYVRDDVLAPGGIPAAQQEG